MTKKWANFNRCYSRNFSRHLFEIVFLFTSYLPENPDEVITHMNLIREFRLMSLLGFHLSEFPLELFWDFWNRFESEQNYKTFIIILTL